MKRKARVNRSQFKRKYLLSGYKQGPTFQFPDLRELSYRWLREDWLSGSINAHRRASNILMFMRLRAQCISAEFLLRSVRLQAVVRRTPPWEKAAGVSQRAGVDIPHQSLRA